MKKFILAALILSGCTTSNNEADFLCGAQDGQPCRTISEVDGRQAVTRRTPQGHQATTRRQAKPQAKTVASGAGVRVPEQTGRMWIAPHMGDGAVMHEDTTVQFVVRNARWAQR